MLTFLAKRHQRKNQKNDEANLGDSAVTQTGMAAIERTIEE
ncbi:MAG: hypothetical protein RL693_5 [Verrucomicrobiota bacterium]|jgi:hypothetical protein